MTHDMTTGSITGGLLRFALPLMLGNLLQQFYNIADTWVVGRFLGADALASVGSSYTLMVFLTSILLGLCMGSGAFFSILFGRKDDERLKHQYFSLLLSDRRGYLAPDRFGICRAGSDSSHAAGSGRTDRIDAQLSMGYLLGHSGYLFIQLLCQFTPFCG